MHPRLFTIDRFGTSLTVSTYGLLVAVGVMVGIYLGYRNAKRIGLRTDDFLDLCFWGLVVALLGSRLMFVLTNLDRFRGSYWRALFIWEGGLVFYGGVVSACAVGLYLMWRRRLPFLRSGDVIAPVLSLGHAFGRLGCFMAGCCWGKACPEPVGVRFGTESVVHENLVAQGKLDPITHPTTAALHPVQLYEATGEIAIFATLLWLSARKRFDGMVFFSYLAMYAVLRPPVYQGINEAGQPATENQAVVAYEIRNNHLPVDSELFASVITHEGTGFIGLNLQCSASQAGSVENSTIKDTQGQAVDPGLPLLNDDGQAIDSFQSKPVLPCGTDGITSKIGYVLLLGLMIATSFYQTLQTQRASRQLLSPVAGQMKVCLWGCRLWADDLMMLWC